jgi:phage terminase Nu1 subunit (DNA packaging protein)
MLVTGAYPATAEAIAELLNLTPRWVRQLAKEGVIPKPERGKYDVIGAVQGYVKYLQARAEGRGVEAQDVHAERARLVRAKARRAELEVATLERSLLPFDEVVEAWQQLVAAFRARCLAMPSKLAPRLAMSETRQIQAVLTAAVREALTELSRFDLPRDRPGRQRGEPAGANGKSRPRRARAVPIH